MYKTILLIMSVLAASLLVRAQTTPLEEQASGNVAYAIGVKGGVGVSMLDVNRWTNGALNNTTYDSRVGMQLGVVGWCPFSPYLALRAEWKYSSQGYNETGAVVGSFDGRMVKHHYVQVPVMLQLALTRGVCIYTGPKAGYMLNRSEGFKRGDLAWDFGSSAINSWRIGIDVRYSSGMLNIAPDRHPVIARAKNEVLQVGLIYMFTVKK